jgi:hypothetical protein
MMRIFCISLFLASIWVVVRNTHRNPTNIGLHIVGLPLYAIGIALIFGPVAGYPANQALGALLWVAAVAMFTAGHMIEGNVRSITPLLLYRLISSKLRSYFATNRVHIQPG